MDIKNIQNGPYLDPNYSTDSSGKVGKTTGTDQAKGASIPNDASKGDNLSLTNSEIKTEKAFALNVLDKLNSSSSEKLNDIKGKIATGFYNSDEAASKISDRITQDLSSVERNSPTKISEDKKDFLLNDPEVLNVVSERISDELKNI